MPIIYTDTISIIVNYRDILIQLVTAAAYLQGLVTNLSRPHWPSPNFNYSGP